MELAKRGELQICPKKHRPAAKTPLAPGKGNQTCSQARAAQQIVPRVTVEEVPDAGDPQQQPDPTGSQPMELDVDGPTIDEDDMGDEFVQLFSDSEYVCICNRRTKKLCICPRGAVHYGIWNQQGHPVSRPKVVDSSYLHCINQGETRPLAPTKNIACPRTVGGYTRKIPT